MKKLISVILILVLTLGSTNYVNAGQQPITVELNNKPLKFDVQPRLINGSTMVPLRTIFEAVGLDVGWDSETKQITGTKDGLIITLIVGEKEAYINGESEILDAPPIVINGSTLVPARFIAEATGLEVKWNNNTRTVSIKEVINATIYQEDSNAFISGYYKEDFLELTANGTMLEMNGKMKGLFSSMLVFYDKYGDKKFDKVLYPINDNLKDSINLSGLNGTYSVTLFTNFDNSNMYWSYHTNISLTVKNDKIIFELSPAYEGNYQKAVENASFAPIDYLSLDHIKEHEREILVKLAKEITGGLESDYDKLLAIHNWMINNIYYNYDAFYSKDYGRTDAYGTYENKRSVCQGYAELTLALSRAVGIPTKLVSGYALGLGTNMTWDNDNLSATSNHAWNEAFVDNRWVTLDTTWDTFNKYQDEEFIEGNNRLRYFDISLQYLSLTHRIISTR